MSPVAPRPPSAALFLALVAVAGLILGISAQFLRQLDGPAMALGGATAPWLTFGFILAVWAGRQNDRSRSAIGYGIASITVYLLAWLFSYHATFAIREAATQASTWREATPWLLLVGPVSIVLGIAAAATHKHSTLGDVCLALPLAWSMPEIALYLREGWSYVIVVGLPTVVLVFLPLLAVGRGDVRLSRVLVASALFGVAGLAFLPVARNLIHS